MTLPGLLHAMHVAQNKRVHSYDANFLEIVANNVDSFQSHRSTPTYQMMRQKAGK
jgi:hypothetical protein